jgi:hypothetical protein
MARAKPTADAIGLPSAVAAASAVPNAATVRAQAIDSDEELPHRQTPSGRSGWLGTVGMHAASAKGQRGAAALRFVLHPCDYGPTITSWTRLFLARLASVLLGTNGLS